MNKNKDVNEFEKLCNEAIKRIDEEEGVTLSATLIDKNAEISFNGSQLVLSYLVYSIVEKAFEKMTSEAMKQATALEIYDLIEKYLLKLCDEVEEEDDE